QIAAAREMDLLTYLRRFEPEELVHIGGDTYATRTHDSLKISNGKWCWWSRDIGGTNALDYLTTVEGVSFWTPCSASLENRPMCRPNQSQPHRSRKLNLPSHPNTPTTGVFFAYLRSRGVDAEIINHCIKHGQLLRGCSSIITAYLWATNMGTPAYGALRGDALRSHLRR
ncbi:MAG: topoisomerase, partial [Dysosmobacter sp.]